MTSKANGKAKKAKWVDESIWNRKTIGLLVIILVGLCLLLFGISRLKRAQLANLPNEFEGRIVDKSIGSNETEQGSYPYYRIVIELEGQPRLTVPVTRTIYQEAQVGARLKRSAKGLEVISVPAVSTPVR